MSTNQSIQFLRIKIDDLALQADRMSEADFNQALGPLFSECTRLKNFKSSAAQFGAIQMLFQRAMLLPTIREQFLSMTPQQREAFRQRLSVKAEEEHKTPLVEEPTTSSSQRSTSRNRRQSSAVAPQLVQVLVIPHQQAKSCCCKRLQEKHCVIL